MTAERVLPDRLLDVNEAAAMLGLAPKTLYQWPYERRIPVVKPSGPRGPLRFRLSVEAVSASITRSAAGPPPCGLALPRSSNRQRQRLLRPVLNVAAAPDAAGRQPLGRRW